VKSTKPAFTVESTLVAALRSGDRGAFAYLYDNYSAALYGVLLKVVRDEESAQDLLQEAFVKIWRNVPNYDATKGRLFTWMLNVARNLAIDRLRSRQHSDSQRTDGLEAATRYGHDDGAILSRPDVGIVRERIAKLKPEQRVAMELVYLEGFTHVEAAEKLNIPLGTVKTRLRLAVQRIRGELGASE
jgi:RNA polymerase sigma-70 factor (ECF subfamily)